MQFTAQKRETFGSSAAGALRRSDLVPASIYMNNASVMHVSISGKSLNKAVCDYKFLNTLFDIDVSGVSVKVVVKTVDFHPITEKVIHIEFKEVSSDGFVKVSVPILIENRIKSVGIKAGGKLNVPSHSIVVECKADNIPSVITIDVANFGIGRAVFARHIQTDGSYSFPNDVFVLSVLGRGRKDKGEDGGASSGGSEK